MPLSPQVIRKTSNILLGASLCVGYLLVALNVKPFERGFFCDDNSIRYPHQSNTVSPIWLAAMGIGFTPLLLALLECVTWRRVKRGWRQAVCSASAIYGFFWFGLTVTMIITEVGKLTTGRLRPHFINICQPQLSNMTTCATGYIDTQDYRCSSTASPRQIIESRKSFPSGHSSLSAFWAVFIAYYLERRLRDDYLQLLKFVLQLVLCCVALFIGLSRVMDYWHHWSDVLIGLILGCLVAIWIIVFMRKHRCWSVIGLASVDVEKGCPGDDGTTPACFIASAAEMKELNIRKDGAETHRQLS